MNQQEAGLRKRIGTQYLMGCYSIKEDGTHYFTDIRGEEGDIVTFPQDTQCNIDIEYCDPSFEVGSFYSFLWHIPDAIPYRIEIIGKPERVDNKKFLTKLYNARLGLSGNNLELFNNFQKTIFNEVTGAQQTYIYELLQNANDYPLNNEPVRVKFILTQHYLLFMHTGDFFNLRNIAGICSINQGEKRKNTDTIGYKGIGFKTVFVNNEYVYLKSGEWSLRFDRIYSETQFCGECPWSLMPIPTEFTELDDEVQKVFSNYDMRVQFALKHKNDARKNIEQLDKVFSDNQILLFIPHINEVEVIVDGSTRHKILKESSKWVVSDYHYMVSPDLKVWVEENINSGNKIPEKFKAINRVRISFAVGREKKKIIAIENARVYNYLPTELRLGFNFLLNADFIPNGSRNGLHDVIWNDRIMTQCGKFFADWWSSFLEKENEYDLNTVFDILPNFTNRDKYAILFMEGFSQRILEIPCIPTMRDGYYHLVMLKDVLFDKIGIISCASPVLTDEEFYVFSDTTGNLPHPDIRCHKNLLNILSHFNCSIIFKDKDLQQLCLEEDFKHWLTDVNHNYKFIGFLLDSGYLMNYWNYKIFLSEDKKIETASSLYYDIDSIISDIGFLSEELPRLSVKLRNKLSHNYSTWAAYSSHFKQFKDYQFCLNIFKNFGKFENLISIKDNSIHFLHFLATIGMGDNLPEQYPFITEEDEITYGSDCLYVKNAATQSLKAQSWISKKWIKFINSEYFHKDKDKVLFYLSSKFNIKELSISDCFNKIIACDEHIPEIANNIKTVDRNIAFYKYLANIQDHFTQLSPLMRQNLCVLVNDGNQDYWVTISKTIFNNDSDWKETSKKQWIPQGYCIAISDKYFEGLTPLETEKLRSFFTSKRISQKYSDLVLYQILINSFSDVCKHITSIETSRDFLNFLFLNHKQLFKENNIDNRLKGTPIKCKDSEQLIPINSLNYIFQPNEQVLELYNQRWFNKKNLFICDDYYYDLFDGKERSCFFAQLGIKKFDKVDSVRNYILKHLNSLKSNLLERDSNIDFHRYIANIHDQLSDVDVEPIKDLPIFISDPNNKLGSIIMWSSDHYMPSELLTEIINSDLVPISIMDSIHPDYIKSDKEKSYFTNKLDNVEIDEENFFDYITKEKIAEEIITYLKERERNIRFWRWICDRKISNEQKKKLSIFPMLCAQQDDSTDIFAYPNQLCISSKYSNNNNIDSFIREFIPNPLFVSPSYLEEGTERNWLPLFRTLKVTVDFKEIVFNNVLPNLSNYKTKNIVGILAEYADTIIDILNDDDETMHDNLSNLNFLCIDGLYRTPKDTLVTGLYYEFQTNPYPDIILGNILSEEYIIDCGNNSSNKLSITKLIRNIADKIGQKCENATLLRNTKLEYFLTHQDMFFKSNAHYQIIAEMASDYCMDQIGMNELLHNMGQIKLFSSTGQISDSTELYLSTIYGPKCQYMANGISELSFVSENYYQYNPKDIKIFFINALGIIDEFNVHNISLLQNKSFAIYFWETFAPSQEKLQDIINENNLSSVKCIPTKNGMKRPCEVYDNRNIQLEKIVRKLRDGENKLSYIHLPEWVGHIGLRRKLFVSDCLEYLKLNIVDYRRDIIKWITETPDNILQKYKEEIKEYRETAEWLNGAKKWVPLKSLYALEWDNSLLKDNFGGNANVCNPSYMPEYQQDYNKLCEIFDIKILTNDDFKKEKVGKYERDIEAEKEISKRLLYLAYKTGKDNWKEIYDEFMDKLHKANIFSCERISYYYNSDISSELEVYSQDERNLWYVGTWRGPMFLAVLEWITKKIIDKRGTFDQNFLQKLFLHPFLTTIKTEDGGSLPLEVLELLDEVERNEIGVDEYADSETFNDTSEGDMDTGTDYETESSITQKEPQRNILTVHPHIRGNNYESTHNYPTSLNYQGERNSGQNLNIPSQPAEKTVEERLKEKWEKKAQIHVKRPTSASSTPQLNNEGMNISSTPNNTPPDEPFFDKTQGDTTSATTKNNISKTNQNIKRKNTEAQNYAKKAADQESILELWSNTPQFTYLWFKYLLELQYFDKEKVSRHTTQIDFSDFQFTEHSKIVQLANPSSDIPLWIEHADHVEVSLIGKGSIKIEAAIVKVDESSVDIMINKDDTEQFNGIIKARIYAESTTNIIDSLTTRFLQLGYSDEYDLEKNLPKNIQFIYGPPGTGKTTELVKYIHNLIIENHGKLNILVLTPTNKAADVITTKLTMDDICYPYLTRFGYTESQYLMECGSVIQTRDTIDIELFEKNILVTTAVRYSYDCIQPNDTPICDYNWDYVIIDEASMIDLISITYILHKSINSSFIIAGDPKQIQPVNQGDIETQNIYQMIGLESFKTAIEKYERYPVKALTTQHRSIPAIGNLISNYSYDGILKNDPARNPQKPFSLDGIQTKDINFIGFKIEELDRIYGLTAINDSAFHLYSALFTYNMVDYIAKQLTEKYPSHNYSIGIVSPYKAEADAIKQMIEIKSLNTNTCTIYSGTVHKFQGDECDIMFIVLNPPAIITAGSHINNDNIINVAMSRARDYLFFLVPDRPMKGYYIKNRLGSVVQIDECSILHSSQIEAVIFGDNNYIYKNTNVTCHLPVNVYYDTYAKYEVRLNESSLDIQINDI